MILKLQQQKEALTKLVESMVDVLAAFSEHVTLVSEYLNLDILSRFAIMECIPYMDAVAFQCSQQCVTLKTVGDEVVKLCAGHQKGGANWWADGLSLSCSFEEVAAALKPLINQLPGQQLRGKTEQFVSVTWLVESLQGRNRGISIRLHIHCETDFFKFRNGLVNERNFQVSSPMFMSPAALSL